MNKCIGIAIGIVLVFLPGCLLGQKSSPATAPPNSADMPRIHLQYKTNKDPVLLPSLVAGMPQCGLDGQQLMEFRIPPSYFEAGVYSISDSNQVRSFTPPPADDGMTTGIMQFDATDQNVYLLTMSAPQWKKKPATDDDDSGRSKAKEKPKQRYNIVRFDSDGQQEESVSLDLPFRPVHFGAFKDGRFFVIGIDDVNLVTQAAILNPDGSLRAFTDLSSVFPSSEGLMASVPPGFSSAPRDLKLTIGANMLRIGHVPGGLALMLINIHGKIPIIGQDGAVHAITPHIPKGYFVDSTLNSTDKLLLRVRTSDTSDEEHLLMDINPLDGSLTRIVDTGDVPASGFACEHDGEFLMLHWIDKKPHVQIGKP